MESPPITARLCGLSVTSGSCLMAEACAGARMPRASRRLCLLVGTSTASAPWNRASPFPQMPAAAPTSWQIGGSGRTAFLVLTGRMFLAGKLATAGITPQPLPQTSLVAAGVTPRGASSGGRVYPLRTGLYGKSSPLRRLSIARTPHSSSVGKTLTPLTAPTWVYPIVRWTATRRAELRISQEPDLDSVSSDRCAECNSAYDWCGEIILAVAQVIHPRKSCATG